MDEQSIQAGVTIITTIIGIGITYFAMNKRVLKYLLIAKEGMDIIATAVDKNKSDAEVGREVREFFDKVNNNENVPELVYTK